MNLISVTDLTKFQGAKCLFENLTFGIEEGQRIALIGMNGCGKTTLLRIIGDKTDSDSGQVAKKKGLNLRFLEQNPSFDPDHTILDHLFNSKSPLIQLIKNYESTSHRFSQNPSDALEKDMAALSQEMDRMNAWEYEDRIRSLLTELGIEDLSLQMKTLSGGMVKKVSLAQCLLEEADILILDEPTNHLDIKTIEWLEAKLSQLSSTLIMVTHDRYFLDKVCNTIIEIEDQRLRVYQGNYSYYLERKSEQRNDRLRTDEKIKSLQRVELAWLQSRPQARATKQKARMDRAYELMDYQNFKEEALYDFGVQSRRLGKKILNLKQISKQFDGKQLLHKFSYSFKRGERIGVVGPNGSGKTTLMNMITGRIEPDQGEVDAGVNTCFGYFDQHSTFENPELTIFKYIEESGSIIELADGRTLSASQLLDYFHFPSKVLKTRLGDLSGGEKRRLQLVKLLLDNPNFLLFDEPSNDLDVKTLSLLEEFLKDFNGCILLISHDRYFMDRLVDRLLVFDGEGGVINFPGNYTDYVDYMTDLKLIRKQLQKREKDRKPEPFKPESPKRKLSFNEQRELKQLEGEIESLENEKSTLDEQYALNDPATDFSALGLRYQTVESQLAQKYSRWEILAEFA